MNVCTNCGSIVPDGKYICANCGWQYHSPKRELSEEAPLAAAEKEPSERLESVPADTALPLLKRAFMFLEDGNWSKADAYCEKVLDMDPENGRAYLGKLLAELKLTGTEALANCAKPFDNRDNCKKALKYGDEDVVSILETSLAKIHTRKTQTGIVRKKKSKERAEKLKRIGKMLLICLCILAVVALVILLIAMIPKNKQSQQTTNASPQNGGKPEVPGSSTHNEEPITTTAYNDDSVVTTGIEETVPVTLACKPGELVAHGTYEQDGNPDNGPEDIMWIVLEVQGSRALLISRDVLDDEAYAYYESNEFGSWQLFELSAWLNDEFYNAAFTEEDKNMIARLPYPSMEGSILAEESANWPKVFLLSEAEVRQYYPDDSSRKCVPTVQAKTNLAMNDGACSWWLRHEGSDISTASLVGFDGGIYPVEGDDYGIGATQGVRPAIWFDINRTGEQDLDNTGEGSAAGNLPTNLQVGDSLFFGHYEQDNDLSNGKEPIEWIVLDKQNRMVLVISKFALDCQPYHVREESVAWYSCTLRAWLNDRFLQDAFTEAEQACILDNYLSSDKNPDNYIDPGPSTQDQVFLLSVLECDRFFRNDFEQQCVPTAFALSKGASKAYNDACWWWLRTHGANTRTASVVRSDGGVNSFGEKIDEDTIAVRPAMWIILEP